MRGAARPAALERFLAIVGGLYLAGVGINALSKGDVMYTNYLRAPASAHLALVIGCVLIVIGLSLRD